MILRHRHELWVSFALPTNPTAKCIARQIIDAFPRYLIRDRDTAYGVAGETVPRIHPGRFPNRAPLRRDGARPCPLAQARAHDGRGRGRGETTNPRSCADRAKTSC